MARLLSIFALIFGMIQSFIPVCICAGCELDCCETTQTCCAEESACCVTVESCSVKVSQSELDTSCCNGTECQCCRMVFWPIVDNRWNDEQSVAKTFDRSPQPSYELPRPATVAAPFKHPDLPETRIHARLSVWLN